MREAIALDFPLPLLRLSLAAYRLPRSLAVGGVYSNLVEAERGITAGSGLATSELRVLLLRLLDRISAACPDVTFSIYVDDVTAEATGTPRTIAAALTSAGNLLCDGLVELRLTLSTGKCLCTASAASLGHQIVDGMRRHSIRYADRVKSLGVGLGAGVRRNTSVQASRFRQFAGRLRRFAALLLSKVSVASVLRTGGTSALTYGDDVLGVSSSTLLARRRAVAAAISPPTRGRALELTLILADLTDRQRLDPAFDAHAAPIGRWAEAVWYQWRPLRELQRSIVHAKASLATARCPWSVVNGPAAAAVASAARIDWHFADATTIITDRGASIDLLLDPPIVVRREVVAAVRRWRWKAVAAAHPHLDRPDSCGEACLRPVQRLLSPSARSALWTAAHQASLRSAIVNTQWTQARLFTAGLVEASECQLCAATGTACPNASPAAITAASAPGTLLHRCFVCPITFSTAIAAFTPLSATLFSIRDRACRLLGLTPLACAASDSSFDRVHDPSPLHSPPFRASPASPSIPAQTRTDSTDGTREFPSDWSTAFRAELRSVGISSAADVDCFLRRIIDATWKRCVHATTWTRALVPLPREPGRVDIPTGTFVWDMRPAETPVLGTFYTDGSLIDLKLGRGSALGWAFIVIDAGGNKVAAAYGTPPDWITCISRAEAWALHMASLCAMPGSHFLTDSLVCVETLQRGVKAATAAHRPLARVWQLIFSTFDSDADSDNVTWMPAHSSVADIGKALRGDGSPLSRIDRESNAAADTLAKRGARSRRLPLSYRIEYSATELISAQIARYLGYLTWAGNNCPVAPFRDASTLSRAERATRSAHMRARAGEPPRPRRRPFRHPRPTQLGGHDLHRKDGKWTCKECWSFSTSRHTIAPQKCKGSAVARWAVRERTLVEAGGGDGPRHKRWITDGIVCCSRCGAYAITWAVGLRKICPGAPSCDGMRAVRNHIRAFRHPVTHGPLQGPHRPEAHRKYDTLDHNHESWGTGSTSRSSQALECAPHLSRPSLSVDGAARIAAVRTRVRRRIENNRSDGAVSSTSAPHVKACTRSLFDVVPHEHHRMAQLTPPTLPRHGDRSESDDVPALKRFRTSAISLTDFDDGNVQPALGNSVADLQGAMSRRCLIRDLAAKSRALSAYAGDPADNQADIVAALPPRKLRRMAAGSPSSQVLEGRHGRKRSACVAALDDSVDALASVSAAARNSVVGIPSTRQYLAPPTRICYDPVPSAVRQRCIATAQRAKLLKDLSV